MSRGRVIAVPPPEGSRPEPPPASPPHSGGWASLEEFYTLLNQIIDAKFDAHRLAYVYDDEDTDPPKTVELFICKCGEGFERRGFNAHLRQVMYFRKEN